jgi:ketosteroid isomerase-like protein
MEIKDMVVDIHDMVKNGKLLEAFDKYYADDVVMQENEKPVTVGKAANRLREEAMANGITEMRDFSIVSLATGDNLSIVESHMDATHKEWGVMNKTQVSVQHWKDGKIVSEKFYYAA